MRGIVPSLVVRFCRRWGVPKRAHQVAYNLLAGRCGAEANWHFMNYGFESQRFREHPLELIDEDGPDRLHIQLYHHVLSAIPIAGRHVLEIGCGRGGGAAYLQRYATPKRTIGVDLNRAGLRIGSDRFRHPGLFFLCGDAERLPFANESFEVVVNVESSHAYPSMERFLEEVRRVLRPGGFLVIADLRWATPANGSHEASSLDVLRRQLSTCGLAVRHESDISGGVVDALARGEPRWRALFRERIPWPFRWIAAELAGLPGSFMHDGLRGGGVIYWTAILQKSTSPALAVGAQAHDNSAP